MELGQLQLMDLYFDPSTTTERRRMQNRLAQRRYREKKQEQKRKEESENIWSWNQEPIDLCPIYTESGKSAFETQTASRSVSEIQARYHEPSNAFNGTANNLYHHKNSSAWEDMNPFMIPRSPSGDRKSYFPPCRDSTEFLDWPDLAKPLHGEQASLDSPNAFSRVISQGERKPLMVPPLYKHSASATLAPPSSNSPPTPFMSDTFHRERSCSTPAASFREPTLAASSQHSLSQTYHQQHPQHHEKSRTAKMPLMPLLHVAARNGNCSMLQTLLDHRVGIDECDAQGRTALHLAAEQGHDAAVSLLLDSGADNEICDADGKSPLFLAVSAGYTIVVDIILSHRSKC